MKVCFVSHSAEKVGAERSLLETIDALAVHGVEAWVTLPRSGPLMDELDARGISFDLFPYKPWMGAWTSRSRRMKIALENWQCARGMAVSIKARQCDVVYTNSITTPAGALAARIARRPHVWHIREFGREDHGLHYFYGERRMMRWADKRTAAFIANSAAVATKYQPLFSGRSIHVVHQSVGEVEGMSPAPEPPANKPFTCILIGRLHEGKGQEEAIRALSLLHQKGLPIRLLLVGKAMSPYAEQLRRLIDKEKCADLIEFRDEVDGTKTLFAASSAVLVCSRAEAFGRVTVEAMLAGRSSAAEQEVRRNCFLMKRPACSTSRVTRRSWPSRSRSCIGNPSCGGPWVSVRGTRPVSDSLASDTEPRYLEF